jgi:hypothetical protein
MKRDSVPVWRSIQGILCVCVCTQKFIHTTYIHTHTHAHRLRMKTESDLALMRETGFCASMENYSRHRVCMCVHRNSYTLHTTRTCTQTAHEDRVGSSVDAWNGFLRRYGELFQASCQPPSRRSPRHTGALFQEEFRQRLAACGGREPCDTAADWGYVGRG